MHHLAPVFPLWAAPIFPSSMEGLVVALVIVKQVWAILVSSTVGADAAAAILQAMCQQMI